MFLDRIVARLRTALRSFGSPEPVESPIARAARSEFGDFATPAALRAVAGQRWVGGGRPDPLVLAERLVGQLRADPELGDRMLERVDVAPPGFVNLRLTARGLGGICEEIVAAGSPVDAAPAEHDLFQRRLDKLIEWAATYGIDPAPDALGLLSGPVERRWICALAELVYVRSAKPSAAAAIRTEIAEVADRSGVLHRVLPPGDREPQPEHRTRLLLVCATRMSLSPDPS